MIPKIIWFYWQQGLETSPPIVKQCLASWIQRNPGWQVIPLDADSLSLHVAASLPAGLLKTLCIAHQSDLIRLQLLSAYGGVWVDATTYCRQPLDQWLPSCSSSGFFAFARPGRDRLIANWFLASRPHSPITTHLQSRLLAYWSNKHKRPTTQLPRWLIKCLRAVLNRSSHTARLWLHPLLSQTLGLTPYFVFHYQFAQLVADDAECRAIWKATPRLSAKPALLIERLGLKTELTTERQSQIDSCEAPLFKLNWRGEPVKPTQTSLVDYILTSPPTSAT